MFCDDGGVALDEIVERGAGCAGTVVSAVTFSGAESIVSGKQGEPAGCDIEAGHLWKRSPVNSRAPGRPTLPC